MMVLALDTTTPGGSCAVARDGVVLCEAASDPAAPPASRLPAELMALLERAALALGDIDVYAVATGPGSFTGLRVGIATMQGLAFSAGKPLVGVSGFDGLVRAASPSAQGRRIATWVNAWRGEVYSALYDRGLEVVAPMVSRPDDVLETLRGESTHFVGDGAATHQAAIRAALGTAAFFAASLTPPLAGSIAILATGAARSGYRPAPAAIRPLYVHRPDAERVHDARVR